MLKVIYIQMKLSDFAVHNRIELASTLHRKMVLLVAVEIMLALA